MPTMIAGRALGVARNGDFTATNTDPIPGGRLWPEAAVTWNAMRAAAIADGIQPWEFMPAGPRSSARAIRDQRHFYANQPPPAAYPGTSNHGWAIAVDVKTRAAAAWLMRNVDRYGWSWDEGRRVGEWWHFRYRGANRALLRKLRRDPLAGHTASEKRWIRELDGLTRLKRRGRDTAKARRRRIVLRRVMRAQMNRIEAAAERDGRWTRARKRRHRNLKERTR